MLMGMSGKTRATKIVNGNVQEMLGVASIEDTWRVIGKDGLVMHN